MADQEQVRRLLQKGIAGIGVWQWNQWRKNYAQLPLDLSGAMLNGADLEGRDLSNANLVGATLIGARLSRVNLSGADLTSANLDRADLGVATFTGANLSSTILTNVSMGFTTFTRSILNNTNFSNARFMGTTFEDLKMTNCNLISADIGGPTFFRNVDLSTAIGLGQVENSMMLGQRASVDEATIRRSNGNIPESFLRLCNTSEELINLAKTLQAQVQFAAHQSLTSAALSAPRVFISYSRQDSDFVERLKGDLLGNSLDAWVDTSNLSPGTADWESAIRQGIMASYAVILIATPESRQSPYVKDELAIARDSGKSVLPIWAAGNTWSDCIPLGWGNIQFVDGRGANYTIALQALVTSIRALV